MAELRSFLSGFVIFLIWPGHGITLTLPNSQPITGFSIKPSFTVDVNVHCTRAETWKSPFFHDMEYYVQSCTEAFEMLQKDLTSYSLYREYEFVDRSATPLTTRPTIRLPKVYHSATQIPEHHQSCTIAIAMIGSLAPGDPLPGVPTGPFSLSQTINPAQLLIDASYPLRQCVETVYDPVLGWSQAGSSGNIGIFYVGTHSKMGRRILGKSLLSTTTADA